LDQGHDRPELLAAELVHRALGATANDGHGESGGLVHGLGADRNGVGQAELVDLDREGLLATVS
jgi:hypothetical protein